MRSHLEGMRSHLEGMRSHLEGMLEGHTEALATCGFYTSWQLRQVNASCHTAAQEIDG